MTHPQHSEFTRRYTELVGAIRASAERRLVSFAELATALEIARRSTRRLRDALAQARTQEPRP